MDEDKKYLDLSDKKPECVNQCKEEKCDCTDKPDDCTNKPDNKPDDCTEKPDDCCDKPDDGKKRKIRKPKKNRKAFNKLQGQCFFPMSMSMLFGPLGAMRDNVSLPAFPYNISFKQVSFDTKTLF